MFLPWYSQTAAPSAAQSPVVNTGVTDSVIKVKKPTGLKATPGTEAEALRKDPLKNYLDGGVEFWDDG